VRGADYPTSKFQSQRAKASRGRDVASARCNGVIAMARRAPVLFGFAEALKNFKGLVREMWERAMRAVIVAGCTALALLVAGCDPNERNYFRTGIGTQLYTAETASATELQNIYLDFLCRQAISSIGADAPGCAQVVPPNSWPVIVQAGLNDIDARCDSYLAWLDAKRRENTAILTEISAVRFAVDALTNPNITGVSGVGLAAISAAFGLATSTVNNFNSLLLQVDQTTVQTVVTGNRRVFREDLLRFSSSIDNKPLAIHTLRSYLSICMPMTISANINSTVTVFKQTGTAPGSGPMLPAVAAPFRAADAAGQKAKRQIPDRPEFRKIIVNYTPNEFPESVVKRMQDVLCVPVGEVGKIGTTTNDLIAIFEVTDMFDAKDNQFITRDGKIDVDERDVLQKLSVCPREKVQNFYERKTFLDGNAANLVELVDALVIARLNRIKLQGQSDLAKGTSLAAARERIKLVRAALLKDQDPKMRPKPLPESMAGQWTRDLFDILSNK
jgi:hypothetical protein